MCGRYRLTRAEKLAEQFETDLSEIFPPRYNIAPTQPVPVIRRSGSGRKISVMRWGLIPSWATDSTASQFNAWSETLLEKPAFRESFQRRRCLIAADGLPRRAPTPIWALIAARYGPCAGKITNGQAVSKPASDEMLTIMPGQLYRTRLPKYVSGFQLPHKTGDFVPWIANDVGLLINGQHKIVICVFTDKTDIAQGEPTALIGAAIEDAIGRVAQQFAEYYGFK